MSFRILSKLFHSEAPTITQPFNVFSGYSFSKTTKEQVKIVMGFSRRKKMVDFLLMTQYFIAL